MTLKVTLGGELAFDVWVLKHAPIVNQGIRDDEE